ncbi:RNA polymerase sigma factor SigF [Thermosynechococcus vestitus]|uniref:Group 3 RNA polymerase sigma factor n=1 Tax=Thermosynechococcus vestitus (strain NIES-2133 / IAM M-273 / BP-1) TaxID=197221 RepID=Q8DKW3_THEVB|nr:RNA polymerase sigma factor SigF [Thermosynechococcus vestitus]BAC08289.1 group 3 RNA polymerase sigma factor [Thermosynechococcus vestitus BP-1]
MSSTTANTDLKHSTLSLLQAYRDNPAPELRNRLVELNIGLVRKEAHRWVQCTQESFDDLMQVGTLGLIRAIERFDPTKGVAFSSFAIPYIRGEIQHYLRDKSPQIRLPRRWQTLQSQGKRVIQELRQQLERPPTDSEIAQALDVPLEEWQAAKFASYHTTPVSLDAPTFEGEEESVALGDILPDQRYQSFQLAEEDRIRLQQCLRKLEARTCQILEFVFLRDLSQKETAELLGLSAVTVSRQIKKGLQALQQMMRHDDAES